MIRYTHGNLLDAETDALVNTVNEIGVMGKGIALMFREAFPENTRQYMAACKANRVNVGKMFVVREQQITGSRWIINFPTKKHWRHPSKMVWISEGLKDLARVIEEKKIRSVAVPPLGCGAGGLEWSQVRQEIELMLGNLEDVEVIVFAPTSEYQAGPKRSGVEDLTPARALIAELVRRYAVLGLDCTNLEVQKLGWFMTRVIRKHQIEDPLALRYVAHKFGPYAENLKHLLDRLDGSYLHCEKRLGDAGPTDLIWFEDSKRSKVEAFLRSEECRSYHDALEETAAVIDGFESPLGMELLATVDWMVAEKHCELTLEAVKDGLARWPGGHAAARRKQKLFDDRLLGLAIDRLTTAQLAK